MTITCGYDIMPPPEQLAVLVDRVSVSYVTRDGTVVTPLAECSLSVSKGEIVAVVGENGVGKTSLLHAIAGLVTTRSGRIWVGGRLVDAPTPSVAVVFQDYLLLPWRTALGNVAFPLEVRGLPRRERLTQARAWLDFVEVSTHADRFVHQLSGGTRQRIALARALATEAPVFLLDEPLSALDIATRERMQKVLRDYFKERQHTVILVTHSLEEAAAMADRVVLMNGTPSRITCDTSTGGYGSTSQKGLFATIINILRKSHAPFDISEPLTCSSLGQPSLIHAAREQKSRGRPR